MTERKVWIVRTETYGGEYANVTVGVEETVRDDEDTQAAIERASQEVAARLVFERRRRRARGAFWADKVVTTPSLESYSAEAA